MHTIARARPGRLALFAAAVLVAGTACSSGDGDAESGPSPEPPADDVRPSDEAGGRSPEETARSYVEATVAGDCDRIQGLVTESFWTERGALSVQEAADDCREDIARDLPDPGRITVDDVRLLDDGGSEAVVLVTGADGGQDWSTEMTLVQEDGEWRLHVTAPQ